jgi:hypothetical protein
LDDTLGNVVILLFVERNAEYFFNGWQCKIGRGLRVPRFTAVYADQFVHDNLVFTLDFSNFLLPLVLLNFIDVGFDGFVSLSARHVGLRIRELHHVKLVLPS